MILSNYAIKFRTAVFVFIVVLLVLGVYSYVTLPREGVPNITIPFVFVTAIYEGTAPAEMETLVTIPLEERFADLEGVKEITSTTAEGVSLTSIEFLAGQDIDDARQRVKDKVDLAGPDLPQDLDEPLVDAFNFSSDAPIFIVSLWGDVAKARLRILAEDLQERIERLTGVKEAALSGVREREIRVEPDLRRLAAYRIPMPELCRAISRENTTTSAGNIEMDGNKFQVRVPGEFELVDEMRGLVVAHRDGGPVYLRDVAAVTDTFKDVASIARLNGKPSVALNVTKRSGENSVALIDRIEAVLDAAVMPPGVRQTVVYDESDYVDEMLIELENNILSGFILVIIVLVVFMGGRNSLFVALAIPFSMLIAFTLMNLLGYTLNMIVLFSLVIAVGMLVDNAIVIVENIYRHRTEGESRLDAARHGAGEVAWPVITSTLTTCAAFSPLLFWPDVMGQFMGFMPRTLIVVLSSSLFVALVLNPAVCSALMSGGGRPAVGSRKDRHPFVAGYERLLHGALRHRLPVLSIGFAVLVATVQLYVRYGQGIELFPDTEPRNALVTVQYPQGTSIETTDAALRSVEALLPAYHDIEFFLTTVGSGGATVMPTAGSAEGTHKGNIHIEFLDFAERDGKTSVLVRRLREAVGMIPGAEVTVEKQEEGPPTGAPVSIEIAGEDFEVLAGLSARIMRAIANVPGLVDLKDDFEEALPELQVRVDRKRAALRDLDTDQIGFFLRAAVYGVECSKFRVDEDEFDITVRLPEAQRNTATLLDEILIPVPGGGMAPLSSLGEVVYTGGRGSISRKDQKRVITISGNDAGRGVDKILEDVQRIVSDVPLPAGYTVTYAGDTEEMRTSGIFLMRAFAVAVCLILVILVVQFNSALLPLIIVFSVVLSLIGVMMGLLICNMRFGVIMTGVGVISLAGIVVNNAIVLVDCVRQRKGDGLSSTDAIVAAGRLRLRPVLLTATTTILGLIPMAVGYSLDVHRWPPKLIAGAESSQWWAPMAVAVIFGLAVSTLLTLVLVPVMVSLADSVAYRLRRFAPGE